MRSRLWHGVCFILAAAVPAAAADDGAALFKKNCQTCHSIEKGAAPRQGPPLYGVIGRKAGTVEGFKYSAGLKAAGWEWTPEKIDEWISFPKKMIRDTFMVYRQNDPDIRKAIVAYLETQKD
jgi:cytochrome c